MKLVINLVLLALIGGLGFMLYKGFSEPINFRSEKAIRKEAVRDKLVNIRTAQELYRGVTGEFAGNFDTLRHVLNTGKFQLINVQGDPDAIDNPEAVIYDTIYTPAIDSVRTLGIVLESMEVIPYTDGKTFDIAADTLTYQSTVVPVVEVGTTWDVFMGKYADAKYRAYDSGYDPKARMKFGSMTAPQLGGSWD